MPKGNEFYKKFIHLDFFGGTYIADSDDGGIVADSRFGEFHCVMTEDAWLVADFVDKGVVCTYTDEGELSIVMLEVSTLLKCMDKRDFHLLANGGRDVQFILDYLDGRGEELYLFLAPKERRFRVEQISDDGGLITRKDYDVTDFNVGLGGEINMGAAKLAYHVSRSGDEFEVSIGEIMGKERSLMPVYLSNYIDIEGDMVNDDPKKYYRLADKIFLNRSDS